VPAYQAAHVIGAALGSLRAQTVAPHEVIVVDDGSTDDLDAALEPYAELITLVRHERNRGLPATRNTAAAAATGDFVLLLDADDVFLPRRIEALGDLAIADPTLDLLTTDAYLVHDGEVVRRCYEGGWTFEWEDQRGEILRRNFVFGLAATRRSRMEEVGGYDETLGRIEDWDLWLRLILRGCRVGLVEEPLAEYRISPTSLSVDRLKMARGCVEVLRKARANPDLRPAERQVLAQSLEARELVLQVLDAQAALLEDQAAARAKLLRLVRERRQAVPTRLKAAVSLALPALGRRVLARERASGYTGAGGTRIEAAATGRDA
jgi:Glycosyl transferase family 2